MSGLKIVQSEINGNSREYDSRKPELSVFDSLNKVEMPMLDLIMWPQERILFFHLGIYTFFELSKEEPSRLVKSIIPQMGYGYHGELIRPVIRYNESGKLIEPPYDRAIKYTSDYFIEINDHNDPDFLIQIVLEIDSQEFHSNKKDRIYDSEKTIFLEKAGYKVLRVTGSQVQSNPQSVVSDIVEIGKTWSGKLYSASVPF